MKEENRASREGFSQSEVDLFEGAEVIACYTRAQAIEDGVLIDVSETAREAGILYPVAVTARVWHEVIVPNDRARTEGQSEAGRLWDVLWMLRNVILASSARQEMLEYGVLVRDGRQQREVELEAVCGPGDNSQPVLTIMMPGED